MWNLFVYKRNEEEKKGNTTDMTLGNLSYHRMISNRKRKKKKREILYDVRNLLV